MVLRLITLHVPKFMFMILVFVKIDNINDYIISFYSFLQTKIRIC